MATRELPQDFHALYDPGVRRTRVGAPTVAEEPPPAPVGEGVQVDLDEATGLPNRIAGLTPAAAPADRAGGSPEEAVGRFMSEHGGLWRLSPQDAAGVAVESVSGSRLRTAHLVQRADGVEVFNSEVTAAISPDNEVVSVAGQFFPGAADASRADRSGGITPEQAIAAAARDLTGVEYDAASFVRNDSGSGGPGAYRSYRCEAPATEERPAFERPVRIKDVLFPLGAQTFSPAYYLELWIRTFPAFSYVVEAAAEPDVLFRKNLRADVAFGYRVHNTEDAVCRPEDGPAPGSPHPTGVPDGFQAPTIPERLVTLEGLLPGRPWLPDGATTTVGNNCTAYADLAAPDGLGPGDVFGEVTGDHVFDHVYDHAKPATDPENLQASLVGMFFHVNWLHDRWYEAGFDEAAGNAQQDNFGAGGLGGDPVLAEGNDFSGTDNANMQTPADGDSPRMQMFEFRGISPSRTSNHEALITFHEMGHYVTNRLVGNASGLANRQGRAMGEGWGDFFAICMTSQAGDDFAGGVFPVGGWTDLTPGFTDNYYFSIRRYPYSVDTAKNPLTFRHISDGVVLPAGPPRNPNGGGSNSAVHNAGEIWCAALWEVFVNLVQRHGHADAERRVLEYVIGGLKLTPSMPTFTQARDGIVTAVTALDPGDLPDVWAGFAKRGMGVGAVAPPATSTSLAGVVESFAAS
ncbi:MULTISPECIES: M36 family metallopeptidase [unclassified Geodermatophilus]|uniref:M36 family metallopeptidase n=1 Tax=unclassified Geodermatophilus TaxID=2637632 RepID=UPI003EE9AF9E